MPQEHLKLYCVIKREIIGLVLVKEQSKTCYLILYLDEKLIL